MQLLAAFDVALDRRPRLMTNSLLTEEVEPFTTCASDCRSVFFLVKYAYWRSGRTRAEWASHDGDGRQWAQAVNNGDSGQIKGTERR